MARKTIRERLEAVGPRVDRWPASYKGDDDPAYAVAVLDGAIEKAADRVHEARRRYLWPLVTGYRKATAPSFVHERVGRRELSGALREGRRRMVEDSAKNDRWHTGRLGGWLAITFHDLGDGLAVVVFDIPMIRPYIGSRNHQTHSFTTFKHADITAFKSALKDDVGRVLHEWNGLGRTTASFRVEIGGRRG